MQSLPRRIKKSYADDIVVVARLTTISKAIYRTAPFPIASVVDTTIGWSPTMDFVAGLLSRRLGPQRRLARRWPRL